MDAQAAGIRLAEEDSRPKTPLTDAVAGFLEDTRLTKSAKTAEAYRETLRTFTESAVRKHMEDLDRKDVLGYIARLKEKGNAPRTIHNRITFLRTFFRAHGAALPIAKGD